METPDDPFIRAEVDGRSASVIQVESSRLLPILIILALISGVAVAMSIFAMIRATDAVTAAEVLKIYAMELQAKE
jgi:hypothetical protein